MRLDGQHVVARHGVAGHVGQGDRRVGSGVVHLGALGRRAVGIARLAPEDVGAKDFHAVDPRNESVVDLDAQVQVGDNGRQGKVLAQEETGVAALHVRKQREGRYAVRVGVAVKERCGRVRPA